MFSYFSYYVLFLLTLTIKDNYIQKKCCAGEL
jgi:hypothetical protein